MLRRRIRLLLLAGPLLVQAPGARAADLGVDPTDPRLAVRPDLVATLAATPHGYFRFVNSGFAAETCRLFADVVGQLPEVNLHGDAHVEQYAVTSLGRGLTDFDDCSRGRPVIDLVRFGASLLLAARQQGWGDEGRCVDAFLKGYTDGLRKERMLIRPPQLVARARSTFKWDHTATLAAVHRLIDRQPLPLDAFADGVARFSELIRSVRELPADFFKVKRVGGLTMGVGSALDEKYLIVFEGATASPDDDLIVEAKQIRELPDNPCVRTDVGASRVLVGERLIAYEPFAYAAVVPHGDRFFWVHDWTDDYVEASIGSVILSPRDLQEVARDAGIQMGRFHPKRRDGSRDEEKCRALLRSFEQNEARIRRAIQSMADETEAAWRAFRDARPGSPKS
jgi:hypothetical protein